MNVKRFSLAMLCFSKGEEFTNSLFQVGLDFSPVSLSKKLL